MTRPLVYMAGPYSKPDPCENTYLAVNEAEKVIATVPIAVPVIPHLSHFWHTMRPHPYQFWLDIDIELLRRCDVLYRFGGESSGAEGEMAFAMYEGIPVCTTFEGLVGWLAMWRVPA